MLVATATSLPAPISSSRTNSTYLTLLECVTLEGVRGHQRALQEIADANGGTRAAGTWATTDRRVHRRQDDPGRVHRHARFLPVRVPAPRRLLRVSPNPATLQPTPSLEPESEPPWRRHRGRYSTRPWKYQAPVAVRLPTSLAFRPAYRPDPARHLCVCDQGLERTGRRRHRGDHLQPGQYAGDRATTHQRHPGPRFRGRSRSSQPRTPTARCWFSKAVQPAMSVSTFAPQNVTQYNVIAESRRVTRTT